MSLADKARAAAERYVQDLWTRAGRALPTADPPLIPPTYDLRTCSVDIVVKEQGKRLYILVHGWFGHSSGPVREGDFVILKAAQPQGSRYRVTKLHYPNIDWAWAADVEFAPRTHREVQGS